MQITLKIIVAVFTVVNLHLVKNDEVLSMNPVSYKFGKDHGIVEYLINYDEPITSEIKFEIGFVTSQSDNDGLILKIIDPSNDRVISLHIIEGYPVAIEERLTNYSSPLFIQATRRVNDTDYHESVFYLSSTNRSLQVDNTKSKSYTYPRFGARQNYLINRLHIEVGGCKNRHSDCYKAFVGTVSKLIINDLNLLKLTKENQVSVQGDVTCNVPKVAYCAKKKLPLKIHPDIHDELVFNTASSECADEKCNPIENNEDYLDDIITATFKPLTKHSVIKINQPNKVVNEECNDNDDEDCLGSGSGSGFDSGSASGEDEDIYTTSTLSTSSTTTVATTPTTTSTSSSNTEFQWIPDVRIPLEANPSTTNVNMEPTADTNASLINTTTTTKPYTRWYSTPSYIDYDTLYPTDRNNTDTEFDEDYTESYPEPDTNYYILSKEVALIIAFSIGTLITVIVVLSVILKNRASKKRVAEV